MTHLQWSLSSFPFATCRQQDTQKDLGVEAALMSFVDDDHRVAEESGVEAGLSQQHTVSHVAQSSPIRRADVFEANTIPHGTLTNRPATHLRCYSLGHRDCGDPTRLKQVDQDVNLCLLWGGGGEDLQPVDGFFSSSPVLFDIAVRQVLRSFE